MIDVNISNFITIGLLASVFWILLRWILSIVGIKAGVAA